MPPWVPPINTGFKKECSVKVATHYLPFTYSVNFDIIVMTLLLFIYVAIMIALSQRLRRHRHHQIPTNDDDAKNIPATKPEKGSIIDIVA